MIDRRRRARHGKASYAEWLIGAIRRECLDHVVVFGERHLRHVLLSYMNYYNETRSTYRWTRMRPYRARFRGQGVFFVFQSWAGCTTNIFGFDLRQARRARSQRTTDGATTKTRCARRASSRPEYGSRMITLCRPEDRSRTSPVSDLFACSISRWRRCIPILPLISRDSRGGVSVAFVTGKYAFVSLFGGA